MTDIQKEYCEKKGLIYIKPENTEIANYVNWLEAQIQALRIPVVVGRSEQLPVSLIPEFGSDEWINCCKQMFGGKPKNG